MTKKFNDFRNQTIKQIRIWAWAAAVLPLTALAGVFFVWRFFDSSLFSIAMIVGETLMFGIAVFWWWWAMYVLRNLVQHWDETRHKVTDVLHDVKDMKKIIRELFSPNDK